jgi:hypothetical protein
MNYELWRASETEWAVYCKSSGRYVLFGTKTEAENYKKNINNK